MNDEGDTRAIVIYGSLQRRPGVSTIRTNRVQESLDDDGVHAGGKAVFVHEPIESRWRDQFNRQVREEVNNTSTKTTPRSQVSLTTGQI